MTCDNFAIILEVLKGIDTQLDSNQISRDVFSYKAIGCTENRWLRIMEIMCEDGLLRGLTLDRSSAHYGTHKPQFENVRITLKGLEYLRDNQR